VKTIAVAAIGVGIGAAAVIGALIGIGAYQQSLVQEQVDKENKAVIDLFKKIGQDQKISPGIQDSPLPKTTSPLQTPPDKSHATILPPEPVQPAPKENSCDKSYPDFCIPSPPPDLDCKNISQKKFTVLQPDPHHFDDDKDGIGCES
jgi:hypothetical protein